MSSEVPVILYRYDASPFSHKIDNVLSLKRIPYYKVDVSSTLPRPEITEYLGLPYRRIPILAIGNDVYCDTSLIVPVLEQRFPAEKGFETIFPAPKHGCNPDTGLIKALSKFYADDNLFALAAELLPWTKFPPSFVSDRSQFYGSQVDLKAIEQSVPYKQSILAAHLLLLEEQLKDSREWLFNTVQPSLADISLHFVFAWARTFKSTKAVFDAKEIPFTLRWLDRLTALISKERQGQPPPIKLHGEEAATKIASSTHESYGVVGFDVTDASRLGFALDDTVQVAPVDTGKNKPTTGKLVALSREQIVLEIRGSKGLIRCHFPRLGFSAKKASLAKL